jgi:hypothetical protein
MERGSEILVPDYICSIVVDVIVASGYVARYYSVNSTLTPNWVNLHFNMGHQTRALLIVHYFGIAQDIDAAQNFCYKHSLILIEDNAHGFGTTRLGSPLGTFGEIGISSPRKVLDVRNGGILYSKPNTTGTLRSAIEQPGRVVWKMRHSIKEALKRVPTIARLLKRKPNYFSEEEGRELFLSNEIWLADSEAIVQIEATNLTNMRLLRQACWKIWQDWGRRHNLLPVFSEIHTEDSPLCYPVRCLDREARAAWFAWGWNHHLDVHSWPALPQFVIDHNLSGCEHWREIICFPITVDMIPDFLRAILND